MTIVHLQKVKHIDFAKSSNEAEIIVGGEYDDSVGYFVKPTVIVTTTLITSLWKKIFGPVLTVYVYKDADLDKTLKICDNTSPYALTGAIFAKDRLAVNKMVSALQNSAGNYINDKPTGAVVDSSHSVVLGNLVQTIKLVVFSTFLDGFLTEQ